LLLAEEEAELLIPRKALWAEAAEAAEDTALALLL
jgi:hypothetical protein